MQIPFRLQPKPYIVSPCLEQIETVYDDEDMLVINKPAGLLSQPGRLEANKDCVLTRLQKEYETPYLIHRLDLDTSGLMVIGLNKAAAGKLGQLFEKRKVHKEYVAIASGIIENDHGTIELPIRPNWDDRPLQMVCYESGKSALTEYTVLERDIEKNRTRVKLVPHTGRSHQLRIHMAEIGHALVGCDLYASDEVCYAGERLMLHAQKLEFLRPVTQQPMRIEAVALF